MEQKFKIAEFAALVGTSPKTIYNQIEKGKLITVNEIQNGREIALIVTSDEQIQEFQNIYGKVKVNESNYEDILTVNESEYTVNEIQNQQNQYSLENSIDKLITYNNQLQERLMKVTDEVIESKSRIPLLEDKANREGLYLKEINELKKINNLRNRQLITFIICSLLIISGMVIALMYQHFNPKTVTQEKQVIKVITVDSTGKPVSVLTEKNPAQ